MRGSVMKRGKTWSTCSTSALTHGKKRQKVTLDTYSHVSEGPPGGRRVKGRKPGLRVVVVVSQIDRRGTVPQSGRRRRREVPHGPYSAVRQNAARLHAGHMSFDNIVVQLRFPNTNSEPEATPHNASPDETGTAWRIPSGMRRLLSVARLAVRSRVC